MNNDTVHIHARVRDRDYEQTLDWLTASVPIVLISVLYYRWSAVALLTLALGGYLMAERLIAWARKQDFADVHLTPALPNALFCAFCLSAVAPWWSAALFGGVAAAFAAVPQCIRMRWENSRFAKPTVHPVLISIVLIRVLFPSVFAVYTVPTQFRSVDSVTAATPLAALGGEELSLELWQMFFGVHAGAIGETCTAVILLAAVYLLLRRRICLIAPACLLATVALLSWAIWGAPLYALLCGGLVLGTLLFADNRYAPSSPRDQAVVGVVAGVVTVLTRCFGTWAEGVALGIVTAQLVTPFLPLVYRVCGFVWRHVSAWCVRAWTWAKPYLKRACAFLRAKIKTAFDAIRDLIRKSKNNS